jgi:maltooligosyltrehalose trehalohydrolase
MNRKSALGATYLGDGRCQFVVWAPLAREVDIHFTAPQERMVSLSKEARGYYQGTVEGAEPGSLYFYRLNGRDEYPDPASRFQPRGVHGPSRVVDSRFPWTDGDWSGIPLKDYIIYELHVGTFTSAGTFEAIVPYLDELTGLGITAVELMPVAQFPGNRNWGYDGVYPFAVQDSYGGPDGLKRLVDTCHQRGLAVILDVVYNHLGPEGNYFGKFGHYFTERYHTLWGSALNFDGPHSDEVRRYFIENALYWLREFHIDALRLDALHAILDASPRTFLEELATSVHKQAERLHRRAYLIGESTANDARLLRPVELGGYGLDAQWNDEFHHSLHVLLSGERMGYYQDFGRMRHLVKAFHEGFVYSGEYSSYRQRRHGVSSCGIPADRFVVFAQNHDQVGNRARSERLGQLISFEGLKLAAGTVLLSPFIPLLFMGEEYAEPAPFPYFISHSDPRLIETVRKGRRREFTAFQWHGEPADPQDEATFLQAKLNHGLRNEGQHWVLLEFYRELIRLRKESPALASPSKDSLEVQGYEKAKVLFLRRWSEEEEVCLVFNFSNTQSSGAVPFPEGRWHRELGSADGQWGGQGGALPEWLDSGGKVVLTLGPWEFAVFKRVKGG